MLSCKNCTSFLGIEASRRETRADIGGDFLLVGGVGVGWVTSGVRFHSTTDLQSESTC
jgi:hypothetical protein